MIGQALESSFVFRGIEKRWLQEVSNHLSYQLEAKAS